MTVSFNMIGYTSEYNAVIEDILKTIPFTQDVVFYFCAGREGEEIFPLTEISILPKENLFVVIQAHEGADSHEYRQFIGALMKCGVIPKHIILNSTCLLDIDTPITHIGSIVNYAGTAYSTLGEMSEVYPTHHYVCLNRLDRWYRYAIVKELLDRKLDLFGKISYIEMPANVDDKYKDRFPMFVDSSNVTYDRSHIIDDLQIREGAFNIITESAYETVSNEADHHTKPALTEKTYKAIVLAQLPIFVAPKYTVQCYRERGFDPFDDIIDHSYDTEGNPQIRIKKIADQIEHFCLMNINDLVSLKSSLMPRFVKNYNNLKYWAFNHSGEKPYWEKYFNEIGMI